MTIHSPAAIRRSRRGKWDRPFLLLLTAIGGSYVVLIVAMLVADLAYTTPDHLLEALDSAPIRYAIFLSLISCSITAILSVWVAVPLGYVMSRWDDEPIRRFLDRLARPVERAAGRWLASLVRLLNPKLWIDALLDIPVVLPPLVLGLSLLILFNIPLDFHSELPRQDRLTLENWLRGTFGLRVTYGVPSVILAQFAVACAFAVRTMRVTFDQITPRPEQVALTLGCSRAQAFWLVVLPEALRGVVTAATLAWARALGEFGPILVFSGATRMRTEVLSTTVFLELSVGRLEAAVAVSLLMVAAAAIVLAIVRVYGLETYRQT
jgi:molybdate transport system permease protein